MKIPLKEILEYYCREGESYTEPYGVLCDKYGEKVVDAKIDKCDRKGYIEYGVSQRSGWLSKKGEAKLSKIKDKI